MGRHLQRQLWTSFKKDRGNWWVDVAEEVKLGATSGNSRNPLKLIPDTAEC